MIVLDTDVMIDILRRHPPAISWLTSLGDELIALPGYVVMELVQGSRTKNEQDKLMRALSGYKVTWPAEESCNTALASFAQYNLSHNLGVIDALIAHTDLELAAPLHTFNQKHYAPIADLATVQPYVRTTA